MEPSWHQNRSKWKVILENLKIPQIVLSLQRGLDFQGFGVRYSDIKSMVFKGFSAENPQDAPRRAQDARRCSQDSRRCPQDGPKTPPRRAQDAPRRLRSTPRRPQEEAQDEPGAEKIGPDLGSKCDLQRTLLQSSIFECFGMDFGRVLGWFRGAIEIDFSWILRVIGQVRKARLISRSWLAADPVVARVSREAA